MKGEVFPGSILTRKLFDGRNYVNICYISTKTCVSKGGNHDQEKVAGD
jgi:hypothetical protein